MKSNEKVVSYSVSTSNHNYLPTQAQADLVVSYSVSTSNHNSQLRDCSRNKLYLILFLHQTTTYGNLWIEKQRVTAVFNSQKYPYYRDEVNLMSLFPVSNVKELHFDSHESI